MPHSLSTGVAFSIRANDAATLFELLLVKNDAIATDTQARSLRHTNSANARRIALAAARELGNARGAVSAQQQIARSLRSLETAVATGTSSPYHVARNLKSGINPEYGLQVTPQPTHPTQAGAFRQGFKTGYGRVRIKAIAETEVKKPLYSLANSAERELQQLQIAAEVAELYHPNLLNDFTIEAAVSAFGAQLKFVEASFEGRIREVDYRMKNFTHRGLAGAAVRQARSFVIDRESTGDSARAFAPLRRLIVVDAAIHSVERELSDRKLHLFAPLSAEQREDLLPVIVEALKPVVASLPPEPVLSTGVGLA